MISLKIIRVGWVEWRTAIRRGLLELHRRRSFYLFMGLSRAGMVVDVDMVFARVLNPVLLGLRWDHEWENAIGVGGDFLLCNFFYYRAHSFSFYVCESERPYGIQILSIFCNSDRDYLKYIKILNIQLEF